MILTKLLWFLEIYLVFFIFILVLDFFIDSNSESFSDYKISTLIANRKTIIRNTRMILDFWGIVLFIISFFIMFTFLMISRLVILLFTPFLFIKYLLRIRNKEEIILSALYVETFPTNFGWIKFFSYSKPIYDANLIVYNILKRIYIGGSRISILWLLCERTKIFILGVPFKLISHSFYFSLVLYDSLSRDDGPNIISENIPFNINSFIILTVLENISIEKHKIYFDNGIKFNPFKRYSKSIENRVAGVLFDNSSVEIKKIDHASLGKRACSPILTSKRSMHGIETVEVSKDSYITGNTFTNPKTFKEITPKNAQIIKEEGLNDEFKRAHLLRQVDLMRFYCYNSAYIQNFNRDRLEKTNGSYFKEIMWSSEFKNISEEEKNILEKNYLAQREYIEKDKKGFEEVKKVLNAGFEVKNQIFLNVMFARSMTSFNSDHKKTVEDLKIFSSIVSKYNRTGEITINKNIYIPNSCGNVENYSPTKDGWNGIP